MSERMSPREKYIFSGKKLFQKKLDVQGKSGTIDGVTARFLVEHTTNPFREDKEERKFFCDYSYLVHRGSIVYYEDENYLVNSDVDKNLIHYSAMIKKCNNFLTFQNANLDTVQYPCMYTNKTLYSDGSSDNKYTKFNDDLINITVSNNTDTQSIQLNQRFIFNNHEDDIYEVTLIDRSTYPGLLYITMKSSLKEEDDRVDLNLANYKKKPIIDNPIDEYTIEITGEDNCLINFNESYEAMVKLNGSLILDKSILWTIEGSQAEISNVDGMNCTIKGLSYGNVKLVATLSDDISVYTKINILIRNIF